MKFMRKNILTIMFTAAATIIAFAACNNNETSDTTIRKPIGENVTGKWTQVKSYEKQDGKWVEVIEPEGSGTTYLMSSDGTMRSIVTMASPHEKYHLDGQRHRQHNDSLQRVRLQGLSSDR